MEEKQVVDSFRFNLRNTVVTYLCVIAPQALISLVSDHATREELLSVIVTTVILTPIIWFGSHEYWDWKYGPPASSDTEQDQ